MIKKRRVILVAAVASLAGGIAGGAFAVVNGKSSDRQAIVPVQVASRVGAIPPFVGDPQQGVEKLAKGLRSVRAPRIISVPAVTIGEARRPAGGELSFDLAVPSLRGGDETQAMWEGDVFAAAVQEKYAASGLGNIVSIEATLVTPSGEHKAIGGGLGNVVPGQIFATPPAGLADSVAARAEAQGLRDANLETVRGIQRALIITATTDTPRETAAMLLKDGVLTKLLGVPPTTYEGVLLKVSDATGNPVYNVGTASRAASSIVWVSPELGLSLPRPGLRDTP